MERLRRMKLTQTRERMLKIHREIDEEYNGLTMFMLISIIVIMEYGWIYFIAPFFIVGTIKFILKRLAEKREYRKEQEEE